MNFKLLLGLTSIFFLFVCRSGSAEIYSCEGVFKKSAIRSEIRNELSQSSRVVWDWIYSHDLNFPLEVAHMLSGLKPWSIDGSKIQFLNPTPDLESIVLKFPRDKGPAMATVYLNWRRSSFVRGQTNRPLKGSFVEYGRQVGMVLYFGPHPHEGVISTENLIILKQLFLP